MKTTSVLLFPLSTICSALDLAYGLHCASAVVLQAIIVGGKPRQHRYTFMPPGYGGSRVAFAALKDRFDFQS